MLQTGGTAEPVVAVHVSEQTAALETLPASGSTPTGAGTTGYQWWISSWRYFVMPESVKEALRSDGTPYVEVSDANIRDGGLLNADGTPRYPIVISLAAEAADDAELNALRAYVSAGGFLFVGSSGLTRRPDGTSRGDFGLASEMGLSMATASLENWGQTGSITKVTDHRLVSHLPAGTLSWSLPVNSEETVFEPSRPFVWRVTANQAEVLANGETGPLLATRSYGNGRFIYYGALQPLIGHGGYDVGMYSYVIFRRAIEWAYEAVGVPLVKLSPWQYPYDAAFTARYDLENFADRISAIETAAAFAHSAGAKGDYYFTTGTLRAGSPDTQLTEAQKTAAVAGLQQAVTQYGAAIGSHNGGLANPSGGAPTEYIYWHWAPDEVLDLTPAGYASGQAFAQASVGASFGDIEGWLAGLDNGRVGCSATGNCPRLWASPYFNSTREGSYELLEQLGVETIGEQKLTPFPHWTVSTQTAGRRYSHLTLPVSEWYVGSEIAQSLDYHTVGSVREAVDFYYDLGALINLYGHNLPNDGGTHQEYITYSMTKPRLWSTNAAGVYDWWVRRSGVTVTPSFSRNGQTYIAQATISGATDAETAVEFALPTLGGWGATNIEVLLDGQPAGATEYRSTANGIKVRVGGGVSVAEVRYTGSSSSIPTPGVCLGEESGSFDIQGEAGWSYRYGLTIQNNAAEELPAGYSVRLVLDTASLVSAGKLRTDGNDLRLVWVNGTTLVELDRVAETSFNSSSTEIWFKTQAAIPANGTDGSYFVYYGNPGAGAAPANRANIYVMWDDFDGTALDATRWTSGGGVTVSGGVAQLASGANILGRAAQSQTTIEMRVQMGGVNNFAWWGWEETPNGSSDFVVFEETPSGFVGYSQNNWSGTSVNLADPAGGLTSWHTYTINWWSGNVRWLIDGVQVGNGTTNVPDQGLYASVYAFGVPVTVDWVKTRLQISQEPGVTLCTQNGTATPTPTPTATGVSTNTPTATPTATPIGPTATNTPVPPTATPTNTPVPSTATNTPIPPTATNTPIPPTPDPSCLGEESGAFNVGALTGWTYRHRLAIQNNSGSSLPAGYSVRLVLDTASLVSGGKLRADGNDLRVVWANGSTLVELDRVAETAFNSSSTEIWFRTQAAIPANGSDNSYTIYYGNPGAGAAPANRANVYVLWDDFDGTALDSGRWNSSGTVTVSGGQVHLAAGANIFGPTAQPNSSIEMRTQLGAENDFAWWGWEDAPNSGYNYIVFQEFSSGFVSWAANSGVGNAISLTDPAGGLMSWHNYLINWSTGNVQWLIDNTAVATATTNVPNQALGASIYAYGVPMDVDWVKARLRVVQEPTVSLCTSASAPTATPTATPVPPTATPTNTPLPPTATPTATPVPPTATNTPLPPTATPTDTPVPPTATNTPLPPTATNTPIPPTATPTNTPLPPTATNTPVPPTATPTNTPLPPTTTNTPVPPTATPTNTPVPPTATNTPLPPTATPTNTPLPPTATNTPVPPTATPTNTPLPPTATNTPVPPTATPTPSASCVNEESGTFSVSGVAGWSYRQSLAIQNNSGSSLPAGYSVRLVLDTAGLVSAGKLRADGNDLRLVWANGSTLVELDRVAETAFDSSSTEIWFRTQAAIPANGSDNNYTIYYGNPGAGAAPANRANVYVLWDDFDGTALDSGRWSSTGTVTVSGGVAQLASGADIIGRTAATYQTLEMRVRMGSANNFAWWGWEDGPVNTPNFIVFEETPGGFQGWSRNDWADTSVTITDPAGGLTTWHTYTTDWWPGNVRWLIDGVQVGSATTNVPDSGMYANFYGYFVSLNVDWVKTRLRVAQEPTIQACMPIVQANVTVIGSPSTIYLPLIVRDFGQR